MANAIEAIVTNDRYRSQLAMANYKAATAHPMSQIAELYLEHFKDIIDEKRLVFPNVNAAQKASF